MSQSLFQHTKHEEYCPQCGAPLQMKQGKKGLFLGCTAYPACDYLRPLHKVEHKVLKELMKPARNVAIHSNSNKVPLACSSVVVIIPIVILWYMSNKTKNNLLTVRNAIKDI